MTGLLGWLRTYPSREIIHSVARARTLWGFWLPVELEVAETIK